MSIGNINLNLKDDSANFGIICSIDGPVIGIEGLKNQKIGDLVKIGNKRLVGEIIKIQGPITITQCFDYTDGLRIQEQVENTGFPLSMELAPGLLNSIFDGIQRPLDKLLVKFGSYITPGLEMLPLSREKNWHFIPLKKTGDKLKSGDIIGEVQETENTLHKIMVPLGSRGKLFSIAEEGNYNIEENIYTLENDNKKIPYAMLQRWPIRLPRSYRSRIYPDVPLITGMRVIDLLFPLVKGGTAAIPGGFGTGKTVIQHNLAKWCDADIIVYVGCGERGNEMADILEQFPELLDPRTGKPLMERTILIGNTSNMPVSAREASIFSGLTMAEYYRDMGYHVALLADSTSRWAEALRELSGRLEEMPAEGGYPAYLSTRLANFYERAGYVVPQGSPKRTGSITTVGAISPPSGDFSEPVTKATKRFIRVFWALDANLAYSRHYPAILWSDSYSLYSDYVEGWWNHIDEFWKETRIKVSDILLQNDQLKNIIQLVGRENLPREQQLVAHIAEMIKRAFLIQNAFDENDRFSSPEKTIRLIKIILQFYDKSLHAINNDVPLFEIMDLPVIVEINESRLTIANNEMEKFDLIGDKIDEDFNNLLQRHLSYY